MRTLLSGEKTAAPEADDMCVRVTCGPKYRDTKKAGNFSSPSALTSGAFQATQGLLIPPVAIAIVVNFNIQCLLALLKCRPWGASEPFVLDSVPTSLA